VFINKTILKHLKQSTVDATIQKLHITYNTVKPLMFACPVFREPNETEKLKGMKTDTVPTLTDISVENL